MTRVLLGIAAAAAFALPVAPAVADHCGDDTLQQPCQTCVSVWTSSSDVQTVCVPVDPHLPPL